jgi:anti-sigma factor RsiW
VAPRLACPDERLLDAFAAGTLGPQDTTSVEAHLSACGRCAAWLRGDAGDEDVLAALRASLEHDAIAEAAAAPEPPGAETRSVPGYRVVR